MLEPVTIFGLSILFAGLLFASGIIPIELCALAVVCILMLSGIVPVEEGFATFGNESVVLIGSLFILIEGLSRTGLLLRGQEVILRLSGSNRTLAFAILLVCVAFLSAFVSNMATLAVAIPLTGTIARTYDVNPANWLLPLAFASVLGGMNTLVGTSTNIIISGMLPEYGMDRFDLFSMTSVSCFVLLPGLLYLYFLVPRMLQRGADYGSFVELTYNLGSYTTELLIKGDSPLIGKTPVTTPLFRDHDLVLLGVTRNQESFILPHASVVFEEGDRLLVEGNITQLGSRLQDYRLTFRDQRPVFQKNKRTSEDLELHEMLVRNSSVLCGKTPRNVMLRNRYQMSLLAIRRDGETIRSRLVDVVIRAGDILLVQCLDRVDNDILDYMGITPLQKLVQEKIHTKKAPYVLALLILPLLIGTFTSLKLSLCCLVAVVLMGILKIMTVEEMFQSVQWRILIFIGAVMVVGKGMEMSHTAALMGNALSEVFMGASPLLLLICFFMTTALLTTLVSNQATAVMMIPLAIQTAQSMGYDPMPLIMTVTIACSCCFMSPFEPAFMLVYGPGGYKVSDFIKTGLPLTCLVGIITVLVVPFIWQL